MIQKTHESMPTASAAIDMPENDSQYYLRNICLFYLKLQGQLLIPDSTIQTIVEEMQNLQELGQAFTITKGHLQSGCSDDVIEMLLLSYFEEESMFLHVKDRCLAEEVQLEQVLLTPTVIVWYMLSLDQNLINTNISFISASCLMFGSYYCFNIHYPSELASTLEFFQRCFLNKPRKVNQSTE